MGADRRDSYNEATALLSEQLNIASQPPENTALFTFAQTRFLNYTDADHELKNIIRQLPHTHKDRNGNIDQVYFDGEGHTPLSIALMTSGCEYAAKALMNYSSAKVACTPNSDTVVANTPLHCVFKRYQLEGKTPEQTSLLQYFALALLEKGADLSARNAQGKQPHEMGVENPIGGLPRDYAAKGIAAYLKTVIGQIRDSYDPSSLFTLAPIGRSLLLVEVSVEGKSRISASHTTSILAMAHEKGQHELITRLLAAFPATAHWPDNHPKLARYTQSSTLQSVVPPRSSAPYIPNILNFLWPTTNQTPSTRPIPSTSSDHNTNPSKGFK